MWKTRRIWPASAAQAADWPRLAEARGSLRHDLALIGASGEPAGRGLSPLVFRIGASRQRFTAVSASAAALRVDMRGSAGEDVELDVLDPARGGIARTVRLVLGAGGVGTATMVSRGAAEAAKGDGPKPDDPRSDQR